MTVEALRRARTALAGADFRRLLATRLVSQFGDGLFQATIATAVVFNPDEQSTALAVLKATAILVLPFTLVGPFTGVFIDRWSRRRILVLAPWLRAAAASLTLLDPTSAPAVFYGAALLVLSTNRFFLATAGAVMPRLVPTKDLLVANSMASVGGTIALLAGTVTGGQVADAAGIGPIVPAAAVAWLVASTIASRIGRDLAPLAVPPDSALLRHEVRRVLVELRDGLARLVRTPRAVGPISSILVDQLGFGVMLTLSLVVFRERFREGVGSYSWLYAAGGVGVMLGLVLVNALGTRLRKELIMAGAFVLGGSSLLAVSLAITGPSVLLASFAVGFTFALKKVPADTLVQEALPDGYRGRVFTAYDMAYNAARVFAAVAAIPLLDLLPDAAVVALIGAAFLAWAPVLPWWVRRAPEIALRFHEGGRAEERPLAVRWGGVEERVEVVREWLEERDGSRLRCFRLALEDGTILDVSRREPDGDWVLERERG
jgi:MFS family permease